MLENKTNSQTIVPTKYHKVYNILSWTFIGVTIFILCMLAIIAGITIYLWAEDKITRYRDPKVYSLYVTAVTFVVMDICFMVIWFGLIIAGMIMGNKHKNLTTNKRLFNIANITLLGVFIVLSVVVAILGAIWLGGYHYDIHTRSGLIIGIGVLEIIKAVFMIGALVVSFRIAIRNTKIEANGASVRVQNETR